MHIWTTGSSSPNAAMAALSWSIVATSPFGSVFVRPGFPPCLPPECAIGPASRLGSAAQAQAAALRGGKDADSWSVTWQLCTLLGILRIGETRSYPRSLLTTITTPHASSAVR